MAFLPQRLLFWSAYDGVPFDASSIDPSAQASPSFQIHAATHRDRQSLYAAHLALDEHSKEKLGPAQRVLEHQLDSEASWVETAVYPDTDGTYSVFVNEVDAAGQPVLRQYKYTPDGNTSTAMVGCWPLFSRSAEWRVFPVDNSNIYYIFWTGPRRQDDWGTHSLFWSRSDTPWVPHVLAGDRHFKSGNPVAVLRSTDHGTAWGLVAWRDGTSGVALCRLLDGKFSAPVSLPIGTTSDVALALNQDRNGVLFVATRHELRALPFRAECK
ncbi:MAG: hypothetical protein A49_11190 [Methyloceanibacter sp.]|nr:MAG: hypothetical protein A49_11190 [Methyloceanibacter sp.]